MSALADRQGLTSVGARIEFLTTTKTLLRELPTKIFPDPDTRQATLSAAQQALDNAIAGKRNKYHELDQRYLGGIRPSCGTAKFRFR